jgi:hypothetical protein
MYKLVLETVWRCDFKMVKELAICLQLLNNCSPVENLITDSRNCFRVDIVEALECLKSWLKITNTEAAILEDILDSIERGIMSKRLR